MRRPNGYGNISKLSGNRRKPYIVRVHDHWDDNGKAVKKIIGYYQTQAEAAEALAAYNTDPYDINVAKITVKEVFERWSTEKFPLINKKSQSNYICTKNYAELLESQHLNVIKNKRQPFTLDEIETLFNSRLPYAGIILILIYTGFRIGELLEIKSADVNTDNWYVRDGSKTQAGINRLVPIHHKIQPYVQEWLNKGTEYLITTPDGEKMNYGNFRKHYFLKTMEALNMKHTVHETRHTFATLSNKKADNHVCFFFYLILKVHSCVNISFVTLVLHLCYTYATLLLHSHSK